MVVVRGQGAMEAVRSQHIILTYGGVARTSFNKFLPRTSYDFGFYLGTQDTFKSMHSTEYHQLEA